MKAQIATEYLFIMTFATVLLVGYLSLAGAVGGRTIDASAAAAAQSIAFEIQSEVILASQVRPGYNRTFYVPEEIHGFPVTVLNGSRFVRVSVGEVKTAVRTPPYQGTPRTGDNTILRTETGVVFA